MCTCTYTYAYTYTRAPAQAGVKGASLLNDRVSIVGFRLACTFDSCLLGARARAGLIGRSAMV